MSLSRQLLILFGMSDIMGNILLIIDDSEVVRTEVWAALEPTGLFDTCLEAGDGIEGYKLLLNNVISLVVCDVVMPGADGYKFLLLKLLYILIIKIRTTSIYVFPP